MKPTIAELTLVFVLLLGSACLAAQDLSARSFLESVAAHPAGDQAERDKCMEIAVSLSSAPRPEVEAVLPAVLLDARSGEAQPARIYAIQFLLMIAMRPDGADLLSSNSEEVASLIVDPDPAVQQVAAAIADYLVGAAATNKQPYLSALQIALARPQTPQLAGENMIGPLLTFGRGDPGAVKSVLAFLHRDDLTVATRVDLVHSLGLTPGLPEEINQFLVKSLDDPDPWVRAAAVAAFADSTTEFHTLARDRVQRMANDAEENPQVRDLARKAMAGETNLNPNLDSPPATVNRPSSLPAQDPNQQPADRSGSTRP